MLYVLHAGGAIEELNTAATAYVDEDGSLVCCDERGAEIVRYPRLAVTAFSRVPFPSDEPDTPPPLLRFPSSGS